MTDPNDPYLPDWRPEYDAGHGLGDLGSGTGFGSDLYELYVAGRVSLPSVAGTYADLGAQVQDVAGPMRAVLEMDGYAEPAQRLLLRFRADLQNVLQQTSDNVDDVGAALVQIAALFATTDEVAAEEFAAILDDNRASIETEAPPPPEPAEVP